MFEEFFVGFLFFADFVRRSNGLAKAVTHMIRLTTLQFKKNSNFFVVERQPFPYGDVASLSNLIETGTLL
jgi:hypothetical protein